MIQSVQTNLCGLILSRYSTADMRADFIFALIYPCLHYSTCEELSGNVFQSFVISRKVAIESYMLTGHDEGRISCDVLNVSPIANNLILDTTQFMVDMEALTTFDLKKALSKSKCVILVAQVYENSTLTSLMKFGLRIINEERKRMAMILQLSSYLILKSLNFDHQTLPFIVAAQLDNKYAEEQILCPALGSNRSHIRSSMCEESEKRLSGNTG